MLNTEEIDAFNKANSASMNFTKFIYICDNVQVKLMLTNYESSLAVHLQSKY